MNGARATGQGRVIRMRRIPREDVQSDWDTIFVFGDNMERRGRSGQAGAMRGEPNTIGVPTKWKPARTESAYFTDQDLHNEAVRQALRSAFDRMRAALAEGRNVVIPADGLGTGLAELPTRAPKLHAAIQASIAALSGASPR